MHHVIVGAGPAGQNAIETLRALDASARITLVCNEPPYSRMVIPYYLQGRIEERAVMTGDESWFKELSVETRFGVEVSGLSPDAHRLELSDGSSLEYDRLLIATGSRVRRPPIEGLDGEGVIPMWTLEHAQSFLGGAHRETVIVGAGFIAFTVLDAIAERSELVHFVEIESQVLPRMLDANAAALMEAHLVDHGIAVNTDVTLEKIEQSGGRRRLQLSKGSPIDCDAVILATGVRGNVEFLEGSGVALDEAIVVDEHMRTSVADVYAAGDVAQGPDLLGGPARVQAIQPTAVDHGRVAAANMAGESVAYSGSLTMNVLAARGLEACSFGRWEETGDVTVVENATNRIYRKYVWEGAVMIGGILVGPTLAVSGMNDVGMMKGLIQTGADLSSWRPYLEENPLDLRRPYVGSGAAQKLLQSTLLAGRVSSGGGFRFPSLPAVRKRSAHHATFGAPS